MVYTDQGLNHLSQTFHRLYQNGWQEGTGGTGNVRFLSITGKRPVSILQRRNCWKLREQQKKPELNCSSWMMAGSVKGAMNTPVWGLVCQHQETSPGELQVFQKNREIGMKFGLWFEPEMVNKDSDLYRQHPDWIIAAPERRQSHGRFQYVLDFSRTEVVDYIYSMMETLLSDADISYIKWDMNRSITECFSNTLPADRQGEVYHRYILGVYELYERLIGRFPQILFESCASGGGRFDPGMLYYAPQGWTSDDTDAMERLKSNMEPATAILSVVWEVMCL